MALLGKDQLGGQAVPPLVIMDPLLDAFSRPLCHPSKSEWVLRRHKVIGKVLGFNYEGFEPAISNLLWAIEAQHLARKAAVPSRQAMSTRPKGVRELKILLLRLIMM